MNSEKFTIDDIPLVLHKVTDKMSNPEEQRRLKKNDGIGQYS